MAANDIPNWKVGDTCVWREQFAILQFFVGNMAQIETDDSFRYVVQTAELQKPEVSGNLRAAPREPVLSVSDDANEC